MAEQYTAVPDGQPLPTSPQPNATKSGAYTAIPDGQSSTTPNTGQQSDAVWHGLTNFVSNLLPISDVAKSLKQFGWDPAQASADEYQKAIDNGDHLGAAKALLKNSPPALAARILGAFGSEALKGAGWNGLVPPSPSALFEKAKQAYNSEESPTQGAIKGAAQFVNAVPLFGPAAANVMTKAGQAGIDLANKDYYNAAGNYGEAAGQGVNLVAPEVAGEALRGITTRPLMAGVNKLIPPTARPLSQNATRFADQAGIDLNAGNITGNRYVQQVDKAAEHTIGGNAEVMRPKVENAKKLNNVVSGWSQGIEPQDFSNVAKQTLSDKHEGFSQAANSAYGNLDQIQQASTPITTQVGTTPGTIFGPNGQSPTPIPVTKSIVAPVDLTSAKATLGPIEKELDQILTPAQKEMSLGLTAIRGILNAPDAISLSAADQSLSGLKSILYESSTPPKTRYIVGQVIGELSPQVDAAAQTLGPAAVKSLQEGRTATTAKYNTEKVMNDLGIRWDEQTKQWENKGSDFNSLAGKGPQSAQKVSNLLKVAPELKEPLGQAIHSSIWDPITRDPGSFGRVRGESRGPSVGGSRTKWENLNPDTKDMLYDPQHQADVNGLLEVADRIEENPNSSNSGAAKGRLFGELATSLGTMTQNPVLGGKLLAGSVAGEVLAPYALAKFMNNPKAAAAVAKNSRLFTKGIGAATPELRRVSGALFGPQEDQQ